MLCFHSTLSCLVGYRFRLARRVTSSCCAARRSNQEETHPTSGPGRCAPRVRSLHRCSRGPLRRAVHGPSQLSRHPCRSTPYTPIPLTLLTGLSVRAHKQLWRPSVEQLGFGSRTIPVSRPSRGIAEQVSRQDAEKAPMGQDVPSERACGAMPERGKSSKARPACRGVFLLLTLLCTSKEK